MWVLYWEYTHRVMYFGRNALMEKLTSAKAFTPTLYTQECTERDTPNNSHLNILIEQLSL